MAPYIKDERKKANIVTTELFTRSGTAYTGAVAYQNGKPGFAQRKVCGRCGGRGGAEHWNPTGWTCYGCGGKGDKGMECVPLYTADQLVKLNATAAKRAASKATKEAAKAAAAQAEIEAKRADFEAVYGALLATAEPYLARSEFLADVVGKARAKCALTDKQAAAIETAVTRLREQAATAAASKFVGKVGERLTLPVTVERVYSFERPAYGLRDRIETVNIVTMRTPEGAAIVVKSPSFYAEKGQTITIKGTVKEHATYRDEAQTVLQRAAVVTP
jgi:hypothetical protein